jgi:hypothetical protein
MQHLLYNTVLRFIKSFLIIAFPIIISFLVMDKIIPTDSSSTNTSSGKNIRITKQYWDKAKSTNKSISNKNEIDSMGWYSKVMEDIKKSEYNITWQEDCKAYQSPNRAQNLRFIYASDGFTVKPRTTKIPLFDQSDQTIREEEKKYKEIEDWQVTLSLAGYGRTTTLNSFTGKEFAVNENTACVEDSRLKIEYKNDEEGMRQNFIIKEKPEGNGLLKLKITTDTKLRMRVGADAVVFANTSSKEKLKYNSLKVWDAENKLLTAHFAKETNNIFAIVVNDDNAIYPVIIDPLSTTANWTAESNQADAYFGSSVSTAGDVNGDGYSDVIVGAYYFDNGQINEGKAFVYHGSASGLSTTANWTKELDLIDAWFGWSVSTAGDVNGDGYSDVIISGLFFYNGDNWGAVYGYFGSAVGLSLIDNWKKVDYQGSHTFGHSVSTAGDVNGDGYSDVIVGAPTYDNEDNIKVGRAFVYHGSQSGLSTTGNWTADGDQESAYFSGSVSTAGDVNGDGYSDVIIGAQYYSNGQGNEGRAFVYHGSASGLSTTANWTAESNQVAAYFGGSVCSAGDVNGDGYSDIIVGAHYFDNGQINEGRAFVYIGSASGLFTTANWTAESDQAFALFGWSVSTAGDVNGDGYSDVIVGASHYDNGQPGEGRAFVYYGSRSGLSATANWTAESDQIDAEFGYSVSTAGDVNGDGYSDVIVGARLYDNGQTDEGRAFVYHGSAGGLSASVNWTAESNQTDASFGKDVSTAGDVNGDGYSDVIIGAHQYDNGQINEGRAFVYHGSASGLSTTANWTAESNQTSAYFGTTVSTAGDVNGDGYSDVIVGASHYDNGQTDEGRAFVYYGSASGLSATANWTAESDQASAYFGLSVSTAGDINGDGYSDLIVGATHYDNGQSNEGRAFVYYGSASGLSTTANWTAESDVIGSLFGCSVSTAGDVNGDGYSDVIIGAYKYNNGQTDEGRVFVFNGSASGLPLLSNWSAESDQASAWFGYSVSTAGDVNGDGFSDVMVGAWFYDNGQTNEGRAFVYHGSASGLASTPNWTAESNQSDAQFGISVSTAGDVNGDGYSDVIVGADYFDNVQTDEGGAFVYHGSASGLSNTANWTAESDQDGALFGNSVSTAGDVNGDGYSDVIVGAMRYHYEESQEGVAFVFYGNSSTGLRSIVWQHKPFSSNIVYSGGITGTNGEVRLNIFGKSPFGRADGKIVYETKENGVPFSGSVITNSVSSTGSGNMTDLQVLGFVLINDVSGLLSNKEYKWRARVQYSLVNNPYQKFGPWKYYTNYVPIPFGCFKARSTVKQLYLTALIEGFFNGETMIPDTVTVALRNISSPYTMAEEKKMILNTVGQGSALYTLVPDATSYYLVVKHRNSIETWSASGQSFGGGALSYDFTTAQNKAYSDGVSPNLPMKQINGKWCFWSGEVTDNYFIEFGDLIKVYNKYLLALGDPGYHVEDVTGNGFVEFNDVLLVYNNYAIGIWSQNPLNPVLTAKPIKVKGIIDKTSNQD